MAAPTEEPEPLLHALRQRRRLQRQARPALIWGLVLFALGQLAFLLATNVWLPQFRDPEYGHRLVLIRHRQAEQPGKPLLLILGSSRIGVGLQPDAVLVPGLMPEQMPRVFNMGMTGAGPVMQLCYLRRLLAAGIRPDHLVLEVLPPLLCQQGEFREEGWLNVARLGWADLPLWQRYSHRHERLYRHWIRATLAPWFTHRFCILSNLAPAWLPWEHRQDVWRDLDPCGWLPYPKPVVGPDEHQKGLEFARWTYLAAFHNFVITEIAERALRELLDLARQEQIPTMLLLMPEGTEFRRFYPPRAEQALNECLLRLRLEYGVTLADTRAWVPDHLFVDGHHLLKSGAALFSQRLGQEALPAFLGVAGLPEYSAP